MAALNFIKINGQAIRKPEDFTPKHEDIYKGEYTTCTGKTIADRVGWRFANMTLKWSALSQEELNIIIGMQGACTLEFDDLDGNIRTETIVRESVNGLRHRQTVQNKTYWKGIDVPIKFIDAHVG